MKKPTGPIQFCFFLCLVFLLLSNLGFSQFIVLENFKCYPSTDSLVAKQNKIDRNIPFQIYNTSGGVPNQLFLTWNCEAMKFQRGCKYILKNIKLHPYCDGTGLIGVGLPDTYSDTSRGNFMAVGTPVKAGEWIIWATDTISIDSAQTYTFKVSARNLAKSSAKYPPQIKLVAKYIYAPGKFSVTTISPFKSFSYNSNPRIWQSTQGTWTNIQKCKVQFQVIALSPPDDDPTRFIDDYMLGIDSITVKKECSLLAPLVFCKNDSFKMKSSSTGGLIDSLRWYVGNSRIGTKRRSGGVLHDSISYLFSSSGYYNVKLVRYFTINSVRDSDQCGLTVKIIDPPTADFKVFRTLKNTIELQNLSTNASSYYWEVKNGVTLVAFSTQTNPTITVPGTSTLTLKLTAKGNCHDATKTRLVSFCSDTSSLSIDTVYTKDLKVRFHASGFSVGTNTKFHWTFGDGTSSDSDRYVTHTFASRGNFPVAVVASDTCGLRQTTKYYNICTTPSIFTANSDTFCFGDSLKVNANYKYAKSYEWYLNGSLISNAQKVSVKLLKDSNTKIMLIINNGCYRDTFSKSVFINPIKLAEFSYYLKDSSLNLVPYTKNATYTLYITGDTTLALSSALPINIALRPGHFQICLYVTKHSCVEHKCIKICVGRDYRDCCKGCANGY